VAAGRVVSWGGDAADALAAGASSLALAHALFRWAPAGCFLAAAVLAGLADGCAWGTVPLLVRPFGQAAFGTNFGLVLTGAMLGVAGLTYGALPGGTGVFHVAALVGACAACVCALSLRAARD